MENEVFIVDDNESFLDGLECYLEDTGFSPRKFTNVNDAVKALANIKENELPLAFIIDINLPMLAGGEPVQDAAGYIHKALRTISKNYENFFLMSAYITDHDKALAKVLGTKVYRKTELDELYSELDWA